MFCVGCKETKQGRLTEHFKLSWSRREQAWLERHEQDTPDPSLGQARQGHCHVVSAEGEAAPPGDAPGSTWLKTLRAGWLEVWAGDGGSQTMKDKGGCPSSKRQGTDYTAERQASV